MAIYDQPKDVDTRVRFFDGQYLIDQDFVDEQKYHLDRERRLGKVLRITGIAEGLAVASSAGQPNKVTIAPGTAIDSDGRQIVLAKERTLDLPAAAFNSKSAIKLYIVYRELETEKAKVGSEGERRFHENPLIAAVAADGTSTDTWDSTLTPVLLAQLNLGSNGAVAVDPSVPPQYAGLSLRGNIGVGTTSPGDYKLNVNGSLRLGGIADYAANTVLSVAPGTVQFDAPNIVGGRFVINGTSGNVGISSATPESKLTVNTNITHDNSYADYGNAQLTIFEPNNNGGSVPNGTRDIVNLVREGISAQAYGNKASLALGRYEHSGTNSRTQLDIKLTDGSFDSHSAVMSLRSNGNVGIGTTSPAARLDVTAGSTTASGWYEAIRLSRTEHSAITHPGGGLLFGLHGDRNFYFGDIKDGTLQKYVMQIEADTGNVGIGTTTPGAKLEVAQSAGLAIKVEPASGSSVFIGRSEDNSLQFDFNNGQALNSSANLAFNIDSNNDDANTRYIDFRTNSKGFAGGSSLLRILENGNVGVGTTTPGDYKLNVNGSSRLGGITDFGAGTVLSVAPGTIQFDAPNIVGGRFVINGANGNVGIGTATPESKLTVNTNITHDNSYADYGNAQLTIFEPNNNGGSVPNGTRDIVNLVREGISAQAYGNKASLALGRYEHSGTNSRTQLDIKLTDGSFDSHSAVMSLRSNGNVGIGTTSPAARLEVTGGGGSTVDLIVNGRLRSNNNDGGLWVAADRFVGGHSTDRIGFWNDGWHLTVLKNGNVGIGTTDPGGHRLNVEGGNIYCSGRVFAAGGLVYYWGPDRTWKRIENRAGDYAGSYSDGGPSDIRFKTDVHPIHDALEKVLRLGGVSYRWGETGLEHFTRNVAHQISAGPNATEQENQQLWAAEREKAYAALAGDNIGLIAQDVESVVPEVVYEDKHGYKHIRYQHLTALLIEAIKEQHALMQALSDKVTALAAV